MLKTSNSAGPTISPFAFAASSSSVDLKNAEGYCCIASVTDATPNAEAFGTVTGNSITFTAHGFKTGLVGQCTTTGALPTGLSTSTNYYVIVIDANTVQLATTLAHAQAGTAVTLSSAGTGTNTFTPTALSGASIRVQVSNDNVNFADLANSTQNITGSGNFNLADGRAFYRYVQFTFALTSGQLSATFSFRAKE